MALGDDLPRGIYRTRSNLCFTAVRRDRPLSRYSLTYLETLEPPPIVRRFGLDSRPKGTRGGFRGLKGVCNVVKDIATQRIIARECRFQFSSWLYWPLGPNWDTAGAPGNRYLEERAVIIPATTGH